MLPRTTVRRVAKSVGVELMAKDANEQLARAVEDIVTNKIVCAKKFATHSKRKKLMPGDMRLAKEGDVCGD